jgi:UbiD family decarboxylase
MGFNDLRGFIDQVAEMGECKVIEGANCESEIGVLTELQSELPNPSMLLFDNVAGYPQGYRVVSNLFCTPRRTALALEFPPESKPVDIVQAFRDKINAGVPLIPPREVETGPVKENIITGNAIDLFKFPVPKWHERDGGPYIGTGDCAIVRDPDGGWINVGTYRTQVLEKNLLTLMMVPGHHGTIIREKYWKQGKPCPIAISCGQEPLLLCASSWERVPWGISEYDFAGGLKGEPVMVTQGVTTDLPIPATAEIVLEGDLMPLETESRMEGPFGEWPGYYSSGEGRQPVIRVKSILHRNNPIIQGNPPSRFPGVWTLGRHYQKAASLWAELDKIMPGVVGVRMIEDAGVHTMAVISLKQHYQGHAKQAALLATAANATGMCLRFVIVVDEDIDPFDISQVLWALGTRCDPEISIDVIRGCWSGRTVPFRSPGKKRDGIVEQSIAIVMAVKPFAWINEFPPAVTSSPELRDKVRKKWANLFV